LGCFLASKTDLPLADSLLEQYYEVTTRSRVSLFLLVPSSLTNYPAARG
jgi:hypothetical protein